MHSWHRKDDSHGDVGLPRSDTEFLENDRVMKVACVMIGEIKEKSRIRGDKDTGLLYGESGSKPTLEVARLEIDPETADDKRCRALYLENLTKSTVTITQKWVYFRLTDDRIGFGTSRIGVEDVVAVLSGFKSPYIFRKSMARPGYHYLLVSAGLVM